MNLIHRHPNAANNTELELPRGGSAGCRRCPLAWMPSTHWHEPRRPRQPAAYRAHHHRTIPLKVPLPISQARNLRNGPCPTQRLSASRWVTAEQLSSCNLTGTHALVVDKQAVPAALDVELQCQRRPLGLGETQPQAQLTRRRRMNSSSTQKSRVGGLGRQSIAISTRSFRVSEQREVSKYITARS